MKEDLFWAVLNFVMAFILLLDLCIQQGPPVLLWMNGIGGLVLLILGLVRLRLYMNGDCT